jgi:hypothetical protein
VDITNTNNLVWEDGMKLQTNNITGDLHIYLDRYEGDNESPTRDLIAWFESLNLGADDEPTVCFTVKRAEEKEGSSDALFFVSVSRLRSLCDLTETMHKVALQQWKETLGEETT